MSWSKRGLGFRVCAVLQRLPPVVGFSFSSCSLFPWLELPALQERFNSLVFLSGRAS